MPAANVSAELRQLRADLEALRREHTAAVTERDRELGELRAQLGIKPAVSIPVTKTDVVRATKKPRKP